MAKNPDGYHTKKNVLISKFEIISNDFEITLPTLRMMLFLELFNKHTLQEERYSQIVTNLLVARLKGEARSSTQLPRLTSLTRPIMRRVLINPNACIISPCSRKIILRARCHFFKTLCTTSSLLRLNNITSPKFTCSALI